MLPLPQWSTITCKQEAVGKYYQPRQMIYVSVAKSNGNVIDAVTIEKFER